MVVNTKQYSWADVEVVMLGRKVTGLRAIEYKSTKEKEVVYGAGDNPQGVQHGNRSTSGTITILQSELEALNRFAKDQGYDDALDFEFDVIVAYVPKGVGQIVTDTLKHVSLTELPKNIRQNDKFQEHALPFVALAVV